MRYLAIFLLLFCSCSEPHTPTYEVPKEVWGTEEVDYKCYDLVDFWIEQHPSITPLVGVAMKDKVITKAEWIALYDVYALTEEAKREQEKQELKVQIYDKTRSE
jgi:hypothetical protein